MAKKFEFTGETKVVQDTYNGRLMDDFGQTLHRIRAVRDFGDVKAGDLGGWIEKESNLSHDGNAWVRDNAAVFGSAVISDNAQVKDNAIVYQTARVSGNAVVQDNAMVFNNTQVTGNAKVVGDTYLSDVHKPSGTYPVKLQGDMKVASDAEFKENLKKPEFLKEVCVGMPQSSGRRLPNVTVPETEHTGMEF